MTFDLFKNAAVQHQQFVGNIYDIESIIYLPYSASSQMWHNFLIRFYKGKCVLALHYTYTDVDVGFIKLHLNHD